MANMAVESVADHTTGLIADVNGLVWMWDCFGG